jgi:hypothetical protein
VIELKFFFSAEYCLNAIYINLIDSKEINYQKKY